MKIKFKNYNKIYLEDMFKLFNDTIKNINKKDYTDAEIENWAIKKLDKDIWNKKFKESFTVLAFYNNKLVGFINLYSSGYLDMLYIDYRYTRLGIGKKLLKIVEDYSKLNKLKYIIVDSSITAKEFFKRQDYIFLKENKIPRNSQVLTNFTLIKRL